MPLPPRCRLLRGPWPALDHHLEGEGGATGVDVANGPAAPRCPRSARRRGRSRSAAATAPCRAGRPERRAVAVDLDLSLVDVRAPNSSATGRHRRRPVDPGTFDLVTARAVLHHVADVDAAVRNPRREPAPASCSSNRTSRLSASPSLPRFTRSGTGGSRGRATGIDYHVGRSLAPRPRGPGPRAGRREAETAVYWGIAVGDVLGGEGERAAKGWWFRAADDRLIDAFLAHCAEPGWYAGSRSPRTPAR